MRTHPLSGRVVVAFASRREAEAMVRWYAHMITGLRKAEIRVIAPDEGGGDAQLPALLSLAVEGANGRVLPPALTRLVRAGRVGLLVADWNPDAACFARMLRLVQDLNVPAVFVREERPASIRRVWVATSGGPNTLPLMWVAGALASAAAAPVRILRLPVDGHASRDIEYLTAGAVGMPEDTRIENVPDVPAALEERLAPSDFLVIGAPNTLRLRSGFAGSVPDLVARRTGNPLLLMMSARSESATLRRLLWGGLIQAGLRLPTTASVIRRLVEAIGRHSQIARAAEDDIVARAVRQPILAPLVTQCETVLLHVELPGFFGVSGAMAVCPDGVDVCSDDGALARFFFLLLTPEGFCEEYLHALARIAKRMARRDVRDALLDCEGPAEVLDVLEPREQAVMEALT